MTVYWLALIPYLALIFGLTHHFLTDPGATMTDQPHPQPFTTAELDQTLAAMREDGIGIQHVIGSLGVLETLLDELPTPPAALNAVAMVRLSDVRRRLEQFHAQFMQLRDAMVVDR